MKIIVTLFSIILITAAVGCVALSEYVTPATKDTNAIQYVSESGLSVDEFNGFFNLDKARKLNIAVESAHQLNQMELEQAIQKDNLDHAIVKETVYNNYQMALQREQQLFGETGIISLALGMAGMGTLTGFLGLMRKRPGDVTSAEMEQALATATGKTTEELSAKQKQLVQLVQGIQQYMNTYPDSKKDFKAVLTATQDTDTQIAVSSIKAELSL